MKKIILSMLLILLPSLFSTNSNKPSDPAGLTDLSYAEEKKDMIVKKFFLNSSTFVIVCKGWPKESLSGVERTESAKEAALMNAQFSSRDLFDSTVDVIKNGDAEKYEIFDGYVTVRYVIKKSQLKKHYKK